MKVVDRKTFLALPAGTIYAKGEPWAFGGLCIKAETTGNDWYYTDPAWVEAGNGDIGDAVDALEAGLRDGVSVPGEQNIGRDGCYDDGAVFLVWEAADLEWLREQVDAALRLTEQAKAPTPCGAGPAEGSGR
jgi:hypothetical protein